MTHFVRPNYGHGCFADLPHLVKSLLTGQVSPTALALLGQPAAHQYDAVVLVLADAFGWRFFERFAEHDPFLQRFGQAGVVACWTSQFPSTTAAHVTCLHSGLPVAQHGVFEWQYYEPQLDAVIAPLMFSFAGTRQRETLQPTGITAEQLYPPQTFYQDLAHAGVTSYVYQHRDYTPSTYSDWMYRGAHVSPYITLPEGLLNMRLQLAASPTPAYFLLYHDKIDAIGHVYGPDSPQIEAEIETFLFCMERAFMQPLLRESKNVLLILTADHGLTHVDPHTTIYLNRDPRLKRFQRFLRTDRKGDPLPPGGSPRDLFLDPLVLPISTGMETDRRSALETIEGVRRISRRFPDCQTCVGLSNVSFGLKPAARVALNSVFLHELTDAGLTGAILHFSKILPRNKIADNVWAAALDLIYDRRGVHASNPDPLQFFIELFKDTESLGIAKKEKKLQTLEERLRAHVIDGEKEGLALTLDEAMQKYPPLAIINDHLLDGMKTVGELFGSGQMQLPFVLQSAEVMKLAVSKLEPHMQRVEGQTKGKIVLATVKGDVHDIGKNLVDIILTNNGYTVYNLGIKQHLAEILKAWKEHKADAIGMSGLLVKSVNVMEDNLKELNALGLGALPPVVLGGAALSRHYCESNLRDSYQGEVFYGKDAFDGLRIMDHIVGGNTAVLNHEITERQSKRSKAEELIVKTRAERAKADDQGGVGLLTQDVVRSDVATDVIVPTPPFWGTRVIQGLDLDQIYPFINPIALFRGQWQVKKGALSDDDYDTVIDDTIKPVFERLKKQCKAERILQPAVVYGYFPCNADGDDLVVWDPSSVGGPLNELERFTFPRQPDKRRLCISDFFRPVDSGETDVVAMHCVTMGSRASEVARELFARNDYTEYLYLHGMGVETAEALAEMWHKRIRQELGIAGEDSPRTKELFTQHYRGSRYSFGYPACPNMSDQDKLWRLLEPQRIGCVLTENWQIDPEQSTSAIVVHHPEAKYFNV